MNNEIIPVPDEVKYLSPLFDLATPITLPAEEFDKRRHKLNPWKYNVFSFLVRDEQGTWEPVAHYVVERENRETLCEALRCFKTWCPSWASRYVMTDDSSTEQKALGLAF
jgi:hypothetical protein